MCAIRYISLPPCQLARLLDWYTCTFQGVSPNSSLGENDVCCSDTAPYQAEGTKITHLRNDVQATVTQDIPRKQT